MPMLRKHNPDSVVKSFAAYSQGVEVPPNARWLYVAGQVGVEPDGSVAKGSAAQVDRAWANVLSVLDSAGMGPEDLVRVNVYITKPEDVALNRGSWKKIARNAGPAITMVTVARLSHPDWVVEVEAIAAKA
jgi:2-iminobutanoate/2-iminopropanoate deaminase